MTIVDPPPLHQCCARERRSGRAVARARPSFILCGALLLCIPVALPAQQSRTARTAVEVLLNADRAFSRAAATVAVADALGAMFRDDVAMQAPSGFVNGKDSVLALLRQNPANTTGRVAWTPVRGGISADGMHGFTFGYLTLQRPDSAPTPMKYMAYWLRGPDGWRVAVYKRGAAARGTPRITTLPPSLPMRWWRTLSNARNAAAELAAAEAAFSDLAGRIGLKEAFRRTGAPDAVNMGGNGSTSFVVGPKAIARIVGQGQPPTGGSSLTWGSDRVIVSASGDLGVSIGTIVAPARDPGGAPARIPFFTIWRRHSATQPWRYIAE